MRLSDLSHAVMHVCVPLPYIYIYFMNVRR